MLTDLAAADAVPQEILEHRMVKRGNFAISQVKLRWASLPPSATTWEDYYVVKTRFPTAPTWGHAGNQGRGDVTPAGAKE